MALQNLAPAPGLKIPGLEVHEEIGRGSQCITYRATRDGKPYAVKVSRDETPGSRADIALQFRREAAVLARLKCASLPRIFEVGEGQHGAYEILELAPGDTLATRLRQGPLGEAACVELAQIIAGALSEIHELGLVHRDVKPQNIIVGQEQPSISAKLIDFGFVTNAKSEDSDSSHAVGTFLYSAPEQSGVIKRPVDGRADLYALGVVLFECASGAPPFRSNDVAELMHLHATAIAPLLNEINRGLTPAFAQIVAKLLSKDPDDRYQTGNALGEDLDRLARLNQEFRTEGKIKLGPERAADWRAGATQETALVGRASELRALESAWTQATLGESSVVLLRGDPGSGKSRLVQELLKHAFGPPGTANPGLRPLVLKGKCTLERATSFAPFRQVIDDYLIALDRLDPAAQEESWKLLRQAAGERAALLQTLTPRLAPLIVSDGRIPGQRKPGEATALDENRELFYRAVAEFLLSLSPEWIESPGRPGAAEAARPPLLLFLDDVQWLDEGSKQIFIRLAALAAESNRAPSLIVCASRNDQASLDSLAALLAEIRDNTSESKKGVTLVELALGPLGPEAVSEFMSGYLGEFTIDAELVRQLVDRSGGSPFAVGEFLRAMLEAGVLRPHWGRWTVDREGLDHLALPTDVVQLVIRRTDELREDTKKVLAAAAVFGTTFGLELLPEVCELPEAQVLRAIAEGEQARLLERGEMGRYAFIHDRVQEAFLGRLDSTQAQALHQAIAETLDRVATAQGSALDGITGGAAEGLERLFSVARHYLAGKHGKNPARLYAVAVLAAKKSLELFATQDAYYFLIEAQKAAREYRLTLDPDHDELMGRAAIGTQQYDEAIECFKDAIARCDHPHRRARIRCRLIRILIVNVHVTPAWQQLRRAMIELGEPVPRLSIGYIAASVLHAAAGVFIMLTRIGYGTARGQERERLETLTELYDLAAYMTYTGLLLELGQVILLRSLLTIHRLGPGRSMALIYMRSRVHGGLFRLRRPADYFVARAFLMAEEYGDPALLGRMHHANGIGLMSRGEECAAAAEFKLALDKYGDQMNTEDYFLAAGALGWSYHFRGYALEHLVLTEYWSRRLADLKGQSDHMKAHYRGWHYCFNAADLVILGRLSEAIEYWKKFDALTMAAPYDQILGDICRIVSYLEQDELGEAIEAPLKRLEEWEFNPRVIQIFLMPFWYYRAYVRLAQYQHAAGSGRYDERTRAKKLHAFRKSLDGDIKTVARRHPLVRGHYDLLRGALKIIEGKPRRALRLFSSAEAIAIELNAPSIQYGVHRFRAQAYQRLGHAPATLAEAGKALQIANAQGWVPRARWILSEFPALAGTTASATHGSTLHSFALSTGISTGLSVGASSHHSMSASHALLAGGNRSLIRAQKHLQSVLQASLTSASMRDPEGQARKILDEIIRDFNAERAFLFACKELDPSAELLFRAGRGEGSADLKALKGYSSTVVQQAFNGAKAVIVSGTDEGRVLGSESAVAHNLRSIMATPMTIRDKVVGVVYVDSRVAKGLFTLEDLEIFTALANCIAIALDTSRTANLELERQALQKDMEVTGAVQSLLIPAVRETRTERFDLAGYYQSTAQSGGDWWWFDHNDKRLRLMIADVTGHGAGAAMVTALMASSYLTSTAGGGTDGSNSDASFRQVIAKMDRVLGDFCKQRFLMTFAALEVELATLKLTSWIAGAPPALRWSGDAATGKIGTLPRDDSAPLGLESLNLSERSVQLKAGDALVLYTDGFYECMSEKQDRAISAIGMKQWLQLCGKACAEQSGAIQIRDQIIDSFGSLKGNCKAEDDLTLAVLRLK